jgi:hypothetical protein
MERKCGSSRLFSNSSTDVSQPIWKQSVGEKFFFYWRIFWANSLTKKKSQVRARCMPHPRASRDSRQHQLPGTQFTCCPGTKVQKLTLYIYASIGSTRRISSSRSRTGIAATSCSSEAEAVAYSRRSLHDVPPQSALRMWLQWQHLSSSQLQQLQQSCNRAATAATEPSQQRQHWAASPLSSVPSAARSLSSPCPWFPSICSSNELTALRLWREWQNVAGWEAGGGGGGGREVGGGGGEGKESVDHV